MGAEPDVTADSAVRARTRRAIVEAAFAVLSRSPGASLAEVAAAAAVGRTTLHRYFPERSDLIAAVGVDALERIDAATARARLADGPAVAALERLAAEYFELGDTLAVVFNEPLLQAEEFWEGANDPDLELRALVERGHAEATIDPAFDWQWIVQLLWATLYVALAHVKENGATRHDALGLALRSLRKAVAADR